MNRRRLLWRFFQGAMHNVRAADLLDVTPSCGFRLWRIEGLSDMMRLGL